jgi:antitoxin PrlF
MRKVSSVARKSAPIAKSRLTIKYQATIPILFEESKPTGAIILRRAEPLDIEYLEALERTLSEWDSENDERAYRDL